MILYTQQCWNFSRANWPAGNGDGNKREQEAGWDITVNAPLSSDTLDQDTALVFGGFFPFLLNSLGFLGPDTEDILKFLLFQDIHRQNLLISAMMIRREQRGVGEEVLPAVQQLLKETQVVGELISDRLFIQHAKSLSLAGINEQQNLASVFCLQYKSEFMASEKTEIPKG